MICIYIYIYIYSKDIIKFQEAIDMDKIKKNALKDIIVYDSDEERDENTVQFEKSPMTETIEDELKKIDSTIWNRWGKIVDEDVVDHWDDKADFSIDGVEVK